MASQSSTSKVRPKKPQVILALASMASGTALVITIFTKASLAITLSCLGAFALFIVAFRWARTSACEKPVIKKKAVVGIASGFLATVAYDVSRLLLVTVGGLKFWPFETFVLFGKLIIGEGASRTAAYTVGTAYHFLNGMLFAVAYCFLFGNRHWTLGIVWALALEASMFTIYPGWLDLKAVMKEFTIVSLSGHVVYGAVLGILVQRWLASTSKKKLGENADD